MESSTQVYPSASRSWCSLISLARHEVLGYRCPGREAPSSGNRAGVLLLSPSDEQFYPLVAGHLPVPRKLFSLNPNSLALCEREAPMEPIEQVDQSTVDHVCRRVERDTARNITNKLFAQMVVASFAIGFICCGLLLLMVR